MDRGPLHLFTYCFTFWELAWKMPIVFVFKIKMRTPDVSSPVLLSIQTAEAATKDAEQVKTHIKQISRRRECTNTQHTLTVRSPDYAYRYFTRPGEISLSQTSPNSLQNSRPCATASFSNLFRQILLSRLNPSPGISVDTTVAPNVKKTQPRKILLARWATKYFPVAMYLAVSGKFLVKALRRRTTKKKKKKSQAHDKGELARDNNKIQFPNNFSAPRAAFTRPPARYTLAESPLSRHGSASLLLLCCA